MKKTLALAIILIISMTVFTGCTWVDRLQDWKNGNTEQPEQEEITDEQVNNPTEVSGDAPDNIIDPAQALEVDLYFANSTGDGLKIEKRTIDKSQGVAQATIDELIKGPTSADLVATIPEGTVVNSITITDAIASIDFNANIKNDSGGSTGEQLLVYSIVNTLAQFDTIDKVKILIDGAAVESLQGHITLTEPLGYDQSLVTL